MIDLYCERLAPGLWAEPVNAATNVAFLIAAWAIWQFARRKGASDTGIWILLVLMVVIGVGSGLFHTFATPWARVLDVVPILLFQLMYMWFYCCRIAKMRPFYAGGIMVVFLVAALFGRQFPDILTGSLTYVPALLVLLVLGVYHYTRRNLERVLILVAAGVFLASLSFRSIDNMICDRLPIGTHFLWHILNAIVLYLITRAYLVNLSGPGRGARW